MHTVNHRERAKRLSDISFTLNVEDTHLVKAGLVIATKHGKEAHYDVSEDGRAHCQRHREVREACLIEAVSALGSIENDEVGRAASVLRALSGLYDQAAWAATSL